MTIRELILVADLYSCSLYVIYLSHLVLYLEGYDVDEKDWIPTVE